MRNLHNITVNLVDNPCGLAWCTDNHAYKKIYADAQCPNCNWSYERKEILRRTLICENCGVHFDRTQEDVNAIHKAASTMGIE